MHLQKISIGLLLIACSLTCKSQYVLKIKPVHPGKEETTSRILNDLKFKDNFGDSLSRKKELNRILISLYANGFLSASFDSLGGTKDTQVAFLSTGEMYKWVKLSKGNIDEGILSEAGFREKVYRNRPINLNSLARVQDKLLTWSENNGYPFAEATLDSLVMENNFVSASMMLEKGNLVTIDSIVVKGNSKLSSIYLYNYLGIKPKWPYNEKIISSISTRLKELPMVTETRPFGISFTDEKATLYLYLENKKASQLDGVVGVLPDNSGNGKINVTGDVRIRLLSSFGQGELFDLNWKQPLPKTQDLKVKFNYPFLFSTPLGLDLNLSIYKKDTTYLELVRNVGVQFLLTGGNYIKAFFNNKKSTLLNTKQFENVTVLPPYADINTNSYGLGFRKEKLDYRINPRSGFAVELSASTGQKTIKENIRLKFIDYDSLKLKSTQYTGEFSADYFIPLLSRSTINIGVKSGILIGDETFQNELYRIGGLKTLRGFDEESILASSYTIWKAEFRYLLEQNSYLFVFVNGAWYERKQRDYFITDTPLGFGAGITFETKLGIFSLNYALGKEFQNPVLFRAAKVHFGVVNYF